MNNNNNTTTNNSPTNSTLKKIQAPAVVKETTVSAKTASGRITKGPAKTAGAVSSYEVRHRVEQGQEGEGGDDAQEGEEHAQGDAEEGG